jgi:hypothetical protein
MLWIILIVLIIVGVCTNNFTPLKVFGKIMAWFFGIIFAICLAACLAAIIIPKILAANDKKEQEAYWERDKQTPLIQWACDSYGRQLHLGERPNYVYQCSTGKLMAENIIGNSYYTCQQKPYKRVNHWKFCKTGATRNTKYEHLLGN